MNALVAIPLATSVVAVASPNSRRADDHELIALADQIKELRSQIPAANAEHDRCYEIYKGLRPAKPQTLLWKAGDDVAGVEDGGGKRWCDLGDIEKLRTKTSFAHWHFTGTEDEWQKLGLPNWRDNRIMPVVGYEHLFFSIGDEHREKRAKELVAALDEYNAGLADAELKSGFTAAIEALDELYERTEDVFERMLGLKPTALEGYRAMAFAIFNHCWSGIFEEGSSQEERMIATMLSSLIGIEREVLAA
jgi:hypothetical protein